MRQVVSETILAAAEEVLAERGAHAASVGEIAARAGVSVGTLYNHFEDRTALVQALYRARREQSSPRFVELFEATAGRPFEARFRAYLRAVAELFDEKRAFVRVALETEHLRTAERGAGRAARPVLGKLYECLVALLRVGIEEGTVHIADPDLAARVCAAGLRAMVLRGVTEGLPFAADVDAVADILLHGVTQR